MTKLKAFKISAFFSLAMLFIGCNATKTAKNLEINTEVNEQYLQSRGQLTGTLSKKEFQRFKSQLEKELEVTIPEDKPILINFRQKSNNCLAVGVKKETVINRMKQGKKISDRLSATYNMVDYFVYTEDTHYADLYSNLEYFKKDSGYLKNKVFTSNQNCAGFLVLKLNRKFMKYYGEDYFTEVKNFLLKD